MGYAQAFKDFFRHASMSLSMANRDEAAAASLLSRWIVSDYRWPAGLGDANRCELKSAGADIRELDALDLANGLAAEERNDVRLVVMSNPCLIAAQQQHFLLQQKKYEAKSPVLAGYLQKAKFAAVLLDTISTHLPNAIVIIVLRQTDLITVQSKKKSMIIVPMQTIPGWEPKSCNTDGLVALWSGDSLTAWIAMPRAIDASENGSYGRPSIRNLVLDMAREGVVELRRLCAHATSLQGLVLFLGEWDASLSLACGRWTITELTGCRLMSMQSVRGPEKRLRMTTEALVEGSCRQWNGRKWTWQDCYKCALEQFAKNVSKKTSLKEADDEVKNNAWKVPLNASYMWYVSEA